MDISIQHLSAAFAGGLAGTVAMDLAKYIGHALHLIGGVRMDMLGRWALGMANGRFVYEDIHEASPFDNEVSIGWLFHYFTGGLVALAYPFMLPLLGKPPATDPVLSGMLFGLGTSILPWFIVYPAFGKGWFGHRAPKSARPVITSLVSHTFYGAGIGLIYRIAI